MTAIILLIFKDTILGFVGSVQLSANDMVRVGDWITMDNYGADGDVIEINLTTVKVSNFDKTITTIPTYSFISDSFKNWRGMQESGGRRIKRDFYVKIDTIKFASPELLKKLSKLKLLSNFIEEKEKEIQEYNTKNELDQQESILNGRKQTNSGLFRKYMEFYLQNNKHINQEMPLIVKQLPPTQFGVPIQIYCFCYSKEAAIYEVIQGDIFDHFFGAIRHFELEIFESPTGSDFRNNKVI
jgi:miniconductance mechanosensitive channel